MTLRFSGNIKNRRTSYICKRTSSSFPHRKLVPERNYEFAFEKTSSGTRESISQALQKLADPAELTLSDVTFFLRGPESRHGGPPNANLFVLRRSSVTSYSVSTAKSKSKREVLRPTSRPRKIKVEARINRTNPRRDTAVSRTHAPAPHKPHTPLTNQR